MVWLNLGLNPSLPYHWWTLYSLGQFHTVKWFQFVQFNIINSIHQVFLSNTNNLQTAGFKWLIIIHCEWLDSFSWPIDGFTTPGQTRLESNGTLHFQKPELKPHHQMQFSVILNILVSIFYGLLQVVFFLFLN